MSRLILSTLFVALAASLAASIALPGAARAGCSGCNFPVVSACGSCAAPVVNPCNPCYRPAVVPAQYRTVYDTVVVAPARMIAHRVPARYGVVNETVMVSPPRQAWQSACGCGREPAQAVEIPAQYAGGAYGLGAGGSVLIGSSQAAALRSFIHLLASPSRAR
jgi:hypothetical protein